MAAPRLDHTKKDGLGLALIGLGYPERQQIFFHLGQLEPDWAVPSQPESQQIFVCLGPGKPRPASHLAFFRHKHFLKMLILGGEAWPCGDGPGQPRCFLARVTSKSTCPGKLDRTLTNALN